MGMRWGEDWLWEATLPMGIRSGCAIFEAFSSAVQFLAEKRGCGPMSHVLDDFLWIGLPLSESHIIMFIANMEERGYARVTIRTFISALSYPHKMRSLLDPARGWVVKKMLDTVGEGQGRRDRLPIGEKLMLRMVKTSNRQWNPEKARLMTAIFMILYHDCLWIGEAVVSEGNLENMLKRSQVEVLRVGRAGHDAVLRMHTFKHNKSQKQVSIRVKGSVKSCPVCSIMEYLAWQDSEKVGASQPVFVWNNIRLVNGEADGQGHKGCFETPGRSEHRVLNTQLQNRQSNRGSGNGSIRCPTKGSGKMEELSLLKLHQA